MEACGEVLFRKALDFEVQVNGLPAALESPDLHEEIDAVAGSRIRDAKLAEFLVEKPHRGRPVNGVGDTGEIAGEHLAQVAVQEVLPCAIVVGFHHRKMSDPRQWGKRKNGPAWE